MNEQAWDDLALALALQEEEALLSEDENFSRSLVLAGTATAQPNNDCKTKTIVDQSWDLIDPTPDLRALFLEFNQRYFWGALESVEVRWSPRMTLCAGLCVYEGKGGLCSIRLSEPLLKLRPRKDMIETLLHEMIHAYLFVTQNNKDHDAHGPEFLSHMYRVNKLTSANITVYHSFHEEVKSYQQHWWLCDGPCQHKQPYYGYVRRAMNRAPSNRDPWWAEHLATCGGTYHKIKEPEGYSLRKALKEKPIAKVDAVRSKDIRVMFPSLLKNEDSSCGNESSSQMTKPRFTDTSGQTLGGTCATGPLTRKLPGLGLIVSERSAIGITEVTHELNVRDIRRNDGDSSVVSTVELESVDSGFLTKRKEAASVVSVASNEGVTLNITTVEREAVVDFIASPVKGEDGACNVSAVKFEKGADYTTYSAEKRTSFKFATSVNDGVLQQCLASEAKNESVAGSSNRIGQKQQSNSDCNASSVNKRKRASWGDEMEDRTAKRQESNGVLTFSKFPSVSNIRHLKMGESFKVVGASFTSVASPKYKDGKITRELQRPPVDDNPSNRNTRALSLDDFEADDDVNENKPIASILNKGQTSQTTSLAKKINSNASVFTPAVKDVTASPKPGHNVYSKSSASNTDTSLKFGANNDSFVSHGDFTSKDVRDARRLLLKFTSDDDDSNNVESNMELVNNCGITVAPGAASNANNRQTGDIYGVENIGNADVWDEATVPCPVCQETVIARLINDHLDHCLA